MPVIYEVYNNTVQDPRLIAKWGFSCYIEEARLLFDTGGDGDVLMHNIKALGIDPVDIEILVISHDHWDHNGGIEAILTCNPSIKTWICDGFSTETIERIRRHGEPVITRDRQEIAPGIWTTGPLGSDIVEQSLVLETSRGLFVITGCAHPHIGVILENAARHGTVWGAMGGFHSVSEEDIESLGNLSYLSASHCTEGLEQIKNRYAAAFVPGGAGTIHRI